MTVCIRTLLHMVRKGYMKLASLKKGGRDGTLVVVDRKNQRATPVPNIATTLQSALERWQECAPLLEEAYQSLCAGKEERDTFSLDDTMLASPLPRAYQWADGSAYLNHVELVRKARGAVMPPEFLMDPLMYQGGSDSFIGPCDPILVEEEKWGIDFEAELAVVTGDIPMGASPNLCSQHILLFLLVNDVSLRNLVPSELAKGFGFFQSKPATSFSPLAVTPDELGEAWQEGKVHLPLYSYHNGELVGKPNAGKDMNFNFPQLLSHAARTRSLCAGSIVGSGTISNSDPSLGSSCFSEIRMMEKINDGDIKTPFMCFGDRIKIEMLNKDGENIFGSIDQKVQQYKSPG